MMNKIVGRWGKQIADPAKHCQAVDNSSKGANWAEKYNKSSSVQLSLFTIKWCYQAPADLIAELYYRTSL